MNIQLSDQATAAIASVIGSSEPSEVERFIERVVRDGLFLLSAADALPDHETPSGEDIAAIREGIADFENGRVRPLAEVDAEIRQKFGFAPKTS